MAAKMGLAALLFSWLFSDKEEQFEFHVSTCAEAISPTAAHRSDQQQCPLRTDGWVWSPVRCPDERVIVHALLSQFHDFVSVMREFAIK